MIAERTQRGFIVVNHDTHAEQPQSERLLQESSVIGHYPDSMQEPGSSYLWVGPHFHLDREEVASMIQMMQHWLDNKRLPCD